MHTKSESAVLIPFNMIILLNILRIIAETYLLIRYNVYMRNRTDIQNPERYANLILGALIVVLVITLLIPPENQLKRWLGAATFFALVYMAIELHFRVPNERANDIFFGVYAFIVLLLLVIMKHRSLKTTIKQRLEGNPHPQRARRRRPRSRRRG